uniref:Uncharacterized protein n=1 Tax=Molossus molossus TaxID=27622 RepID=A0A7J8JY51_MOLMO|nr:hypothetical protein HJG59_008040 [Molossus molossus]
MHRSPLLSTGGAPPCVLQWPWQAASKGGSPSTTPGLATAGVHNQGPGEGGFLHISISDSHRRLQVVGDSAVLCARGQSTSSPADHSLRVTCSLGGGAVKRCQPHFTGRKITEHCPGSWGLISTEPKLLSTPCPIPVPFTKNPMCSLRAPSQHQTQASLYQCQFRAILIAEPYSHIRECPCF